MVLLVVLLLILIAASAFGLAALVRVAARAYDDLAEARKSLNELREKVRLVLAVRATDERHAESPSKAKFQFEIAMAELAQLVQEPEE